GTAATIASGSLTIAKATTSPTGNVPAGATGVEIGRFDLAAAGEAIKIDTVYMYVDIATTTTSIGGLYQVKMYVDGTQVGTAQNLSEITATAISLGNTLVIPAGTTKTLVVKADMKTSGGTTFATGDVIAFQLGNSSSVAYTKQSSGGTGTSGAVSANSLTARTGTVSVAKNTSFGSKSSTTPTGTVNATGVKIASFVITGGSGEAVNVSQITLADITTALGNNFQNLKLKHGEGTSAVQIGNTVSSPNTTVGTYDFSANPLITIASGEQYVVDVYADIKGSPQDSASLLSPVLNTGAITATGVTTTTDASYSTAVGLQAAYMYVNDLHYQITNDTTISLFHSDVSYGHSDNFEQDQSTVQYKP
ncbi:MAG: hypothetical protein NT091_01810, partial [Candidatus Falkowbacteria bacterium]|nr:hypothetical protein [Candidatus Falkowbacteria bacterium]